MEILTEILRWWFCSLVFGLAAWPIVFLCMKKMPDRGLAFTRIFGLLLVGYTFWMGGMAHVWPNVPLAIWAAAVLVLGVGVAILHDRWREPWEWLRDHWKEWLAYEVVFLVIFLLVAWIRANNPEADSTEKPFELAFINAILRSPTFPPNDPWLSGYSISYYYFGYILTAMMASASAVSGAVGFNLGSATFYALGGIGAYGILRNLLCLWDPAGVSRSPELMEAEEEKAPWRRKPKRAPLPLPKYVFLSLLAPFALLWLGNLEGSLEILYSNHVGWAGQTGFFWQALDIKDLNEPPAENVTSDPATWRWMWWWRASRVINDRDLAGNPVEVIDEFPAFSIIIADLHPHIIDIPFIMLGIALALELLLRAGKQIGSKVERGAFFLLTALSLGIPICDNTWDFPMLFLFASGAACIGWQFLGRAFEFLGQKGWKAFFIYWGASVLASVVFMLPFLLTFSTKAGGLLPNVLFPSHGSQYLVMFATLLVPIFFWQVWESFRGDIKPDWKNGWTLAGTGLLILATSSLVAAYIIILLFPASLQSIASALNGMDPTEAIGFVLVRRILDPLPTVIPVAMAAMVVALVTTLWKRKTIENKEESTKTAARLFPWMLVLAGCGLALFPEYMYLNDGYGGRYNTLFKFYYQTWQYWSLAAAFSAIALFYALRREIARRTWLSYWVSGGALLTILVFAAGAVYFPMAAYTKANGFQPTNGATLDASAFYDQRNPPDAMAIRWLNSHYAGSGAVAEASDGQYWMTGDYGRVSMFTGIPSVLGWVEDEGLWRGGYKDVGSRDQDIKTLFATTDWNTAHAILQQYNIRYVFFGELELRDFGDGGVSKFLQNMTTLYQKPPVYIFGWNGG